MSYLEQPGCCAAKEGGADPQVRDANGRSSIRPVLSRPLLAAHRAGQARAALSHCELCAHLCAVNRLAGELGICRSGPVARVFSAQIEAGDELEIVPTFAIAFSGCDMRCEFCITSTESWNANAGSLFNPETLVARAEQALACGARTIMFLGGEPTVHLPTVLELVAALPAAAKLVWKTNAHASSQALSLLEDMFDVWLADYKFGNDDCARQVARTDNYTQILKQNLLWAARHSDLIVRHVLLPGHVDCCWRPIARWLRSELPAVKVSLQTAFWPVRGSTRNPEMRRTLAGSEVDRAYQVAKDLELNLVR